MIRKINNAKTISDALDYLSEIWVRLLICNIVGDITGACRLYTRPPN